MKKEDSGGVICGGVISETIHRKNIKRYGIWADMMAFIMPDEKYEKYIDLKKKGKDKEATKIFDKFAMSQIG